MLVKVLKSVGSCSRSASEACGPFQDLIELRKNVEQGSGPCGSLPRALGEYTDFAEGIRDERKATKYLDIHFHLSGKVGDPFGSACGSCFCLRTELGEEGSEGRTKTSRGELRLQISQTLTRDVTAAVEK
jgi:hypothetical protein